ncbi:MAG: flagellar export chaperone FliS [Phycisphaerae bacterium]
MSQSPASNYLRTKIFTATPEQLQLMLYDGCIRFTEQAKQALIARNYDESYRLFTRAQRIITELTCSLKQDVAPEICGKMAALYNFCYIKLVEANTGHSIESVEDALQILRYQRETWVLLMQELAQANAGKAAAKLDIPAPSEQMEARLSIAG